VGRLSTCPASSDIALVVATDRPAGSVESLIREHGGPHLRDVRLFDQYRGTPLRDDQKSLAYRLRFEPVDGSLREAEVESAVERVVAVLSRRLGAHLEPDSVCAGGGIHDHRGWTSTCWSSSCDWWWFF
jgi:phenylalanyl-tRNA synthetase beta subunit